MVLKWAEISKKTTFYKGIKTEDMAILCMFMCLSVSLAGREDQVYLMNDPSH